MAQLAFAIDAAEHWQVLRMPHRRRAILEGWHFLDDELKERGTITFRHKSPSDALVFFTAALSTAVRCCRWLI